MGIRDETKGYRYYNPNTHQTLTSRNVIFKAQEERSEEIEIFHTVLIKGENSDGNQTVGNNQKIRDDQTGEERSETHHKEESPSWIPVPRKGLLISLPNHW